MSSFHQGFSADDYDEPSPNNSYLQASKDISDDEGVSHYETSQSLHSTGPLKRKAKSQKSGPRKKAVEENATKEPQLGEGSSKSDDDDSSDESTDDRIHGLTRQRTAFYDESAEKQITQIEAKMFYQPRRSESLVDVQWSPNHNVETFQSKAFPTSLVSPERPSPAKTQENGANISRSYTAPTSLHPTTISGNLRVVPTQSSGPKLVQNPSTQKFQDILPPRDMYQDRGEAVTAEYMAAKAGIRQVIELRRKYIKISMQGRNDNPRDLPGWNIYPPPPQPVWAPTQGPNSSNKAHGGGSNGKFITSMSESTLTPESTKTHRKPGTNIGADFELSDVEIPAPNEMEYMMINGIYQVFESEEHQADNKAIVHVPSLRTYYKDLKVLSELSTDGPCKSLSFNRLQLLGASFNWYRLRCEYAENLECKKVPHRDFYNVRKVDTHVHHSACMNQKHLLRFIKSKLKKSSDDKVIRKDGGFLTLDEVFQSINLRAYDLSIDTLDMHAHTDTFHRFDKFNLKYNPIGESRLRNIFLKTDNDIRGRYLAEVTKEVITDLESSKYQMVEWRISIYGRNVNEWDKLAAWVLDNRLVSHNVRWLIQIPRLYNLYQKTGEIQSFEEILINIFQPLFEVTKDPSSHPKLHIFLQRVIGFDSVDDESRPETRYAKKFPVPKLWTNDSVVPYSYWIYYLFGNMTSLNAWRKRRGFNTFVLRPHCGEAGDPDHLCAAFLCCHSISHGLLLRKMPLMQYCFYLEQVGIAMSPLSNNALFLALDRNPLPQYHMRGLNVSLSTDDPLQFAFTKEPLMEEYSIATQVYKFNAPDMCELARNSVLQSGFEHSLKQHWLGPNYQLFGSAGNHPQKTNVPPLRASYREEALLNEFNLQAPPVRFLHLYPADFSCEASNIAQMYPQKSSQLQPVQERTRCSPLA
ncbi:MAG: AMP deaminase [Vezdaea aestivalis]|nr:MAG: AMP deaminase [Vezdaea aestivalis]